MSTSIMKEISFPSKFQDLLNEKLGYVTINFEFHLFSQTVLSILKYANHSFHIQDAWDSANVSEYEVNNKVDGTNFRQLKA